MKNTQGTKKNEFRIDEKDLLLHTPPPFHKIGGTFKPTHFVEWYKNEMRNAKIIKNEKMENKMQMSYNKNQKRTIFEVGTKL